MKHRVTLRKKNVAYPAAEYKEMARGLAEKKVVGGNVLELLKKWPASVIGWCIFIMR